MQIPFDKEIVTSQAVQWRWPSFKPYELVSKGNGMLMVNEQSMDALQRFRDIVGVPVIVNSAYRDPAYNKKVGGAPSSQHLFGRAFDIRITDNLPRKVIHQAAKQAGFTGFGDYNSFVHIDTGPARYWDLR